MKVTDLDYALENRLIDKLKIMMRRCTTTRAKKDSLLIVEGGEGEGKSNTAEAIAYYLSYEMKRSIHMFFRLQSLIEFARSTENKIIIWDEPSIDSLGTDWYKTINKDLMRLLMTCRKKRHFFIFNFVKFYKFSEYVNVDRALGLIHMYSRKGIEPGRFVYVRQGKLQRLWNDYRTKKERNYKKYRSFGGSFPIVEKYFEKLKINIEGHPNCTMDDYERLKDKAIESIGTNKVKSNPYFKKYNELKKQIGSLTFPILTQEVMANKIDVTPKTLRNWRDIILELPNNGGQVTENG